MVVIALRCGALWLIPAAPPQDDDRGLRDWPKHSDIEDHEGTHDGEELSVRFGNNRRELIANHAVFIPSATLLARVGEPGA